MKCNDKEFKIKVNTEFRQYLSKALKECDGMTFRELVELLNDVKFSFLSWMIEHNPKQAYEKSVEDIRIHDVDDNKDNWKDFKKIHVRHSFES